MLSSEIDTKGNKQMFGKRVKLFTVKGVPVEISILAVVLIGILILPTIPAALLGLVVGSSGGFSWLAIAIMLLGLFASILLHELAHALVGIRFGSTVTAIHLNLLGGATFFAARAPAYFKDLLIFLAGPLSNLLLWQLFGQIANLLEVNSSLGMVFSYLAIINFFLGLFNALPAFPLDGGQAAYALIMGLTSHHRFASRTVLGSSLVISGFIILNQGKVLGQDPVTTFFIWGTALWILFSCLSLSKQASSIVNFYPSASQQYTRFQKDAGQWTARHSAPAYFALGQSQMAANQAEYAMVSFTQALEFDPANLAYLEARAGAFTLLGEYSQALTDYNVLLKKPSSRPALYIARAGTLAAMGNYTAAFSNLDHALAIDPQEVDVLALEKELRGRLQQQYSAAYPWASGAGVSSGAGAGSRTGALG
jgi:Zn-dependent protease